MVIKKKMGEKRAYISGFVRKRDTNSSQPRVTPEMFYIQPQIHYIYESNTRSLQLALKNYSSA